MDRASIYLLLFLAAVFATGYFAGVYHENARRR
jgi:hypothetical protein